MSSGRAVDPAELRAALLAVMPWLTGAADAPERTQLASAVRLSLRTLERLVPGHSVEVRVPPFAAVQCIAGPQHTRGTPPNVVEMPPRIWLQLVIGHLTLTEALTDGLATASGSRAQEIAQWLPLVR